MQIQYIPNLNTTEHLFLVLEEKMCAILSPGQAGLAGSVVVVVLGIQLSLYSDYIPALLMDLFICYLFI